MKPFQAINFLNVFILQKKREMECVEIIWKKNLGLRLSHLS